jgi:hypothetical protein
MLLRPAVDQRLKLLSDLDVLLCRQHYSELTNGGDKLRRREGFGQKNAVEYALNGPFFSTSTRDIDDRKFRVYRSGAARNVPPAYPIFA